MVVLDAFPDQIREELDNNSGGKSLGCEGKALTALVARITFPLDFGLKMSIIDEEYSLREVSYDVEAAVRSALKAYLPHNFRLRVVAICLLAN